MDAGVYRFQELRSVVGLSRSTIERMERGGKFPRRVRLSSGRSVGWKKSEVNKWLASRARAPLIAAKKAA